MGGGVAAGQEESSCPPNRWFQLTASGDLEEKNWEEMEGKEKQLLKSREIVNLKTEGKYRMYDSKKMVLSLPNAELKAT